MKSPQGVGESAHEATWRGNATLNKKDSARQSCQRKEEDLDIFWPTLIASSIYVVDAIQTKEDLKFLHL